MEERTASRSLPSRAAAVASAGVRLVGSDVASIAGSAGAFVVRTTPLGTGNPAHLRVASVAAFGPHQRDILTTYVSLWQVQSPPAMKMITLRESRIHIGVELAAK